MTKLAKFLGMITETWLHSGFPDASDEQQHEGTFVGIRTLMNWTCRKGIQTVDKPNFSKKINYRQSWSQQDQIFLLEIKYMAIRQ